MALIIFIILLFNTDSLNHSAIPFWDCTYAYDTDISLHYFALYSTQDSLFILQRSSIKRDSGSFNLLTQLLPNRKEYKIELDYKRHPQAFFKEFILKNNTLYIIDLFNLFVFEKSGDKFIQKDSIYFNKYLTYLDYEDRNIIVSSCLDSPENNKKDSAGNFFIINKNEPAKHYEINYPTPKGIEYTYVQPRKLIDIKNDIVSIADATDYRILLYDLDGNLLDSLKRDIDCFLNYETTNITPNHARLNFVESASRRCMISQINFINENIILATYQTPPKGEGLFDVYHDIWRKKENEWYLYEKDLNEKNTDSSVQFHPGNFGLRSQYTVNDNIISAIEPNIPFPLNDKFYNMTMGEFKDSTDWYFPEKNFSFSVVRYKIEVDDE